MSWSYRVEYEAHLLLFLASDGAEQSLRACDKHEEQYDVAGDVLQSLRQVNTREQIDQTDQDSTEHRTGIRPKTPDHRGRRRFQTGHARVESSFDQVDRGQR